MGEGDGGGAAAGAPRWRLGRAAGAAPRQASHAPGRPPSPYIMYNIRPLEKFSFQRFF